MKNLARIALLSLLVMTGCFNMDTKEEEDIVVNSGNEFTVDGKTYPIVETQWLIVDGESSVLSNEEGDGYIWVALPSTVPGTYTVTSFFNLTSKDLPTYMAIENEVTITITNNEGGGQLHGGGKIEGTFSGNFEYCDLDEHDVCIKQHTVKITGKFSTSRYTK